MVDTVEAEAFPLDWWRCACRAKDETAEGSSEAEDADPALREPDACATSISLSLDIQDKFELNLLKTISPLSSFDRTRVATAEKCFGTGVVSSPLAADSLSTGGASNTVDPLAQAEDSTGDDSAEPATPVAEDSPSRNSAAPTAPAGGDPSSYSTPAAASETDGISSADNAPGRRRSFQFPEIWPMGIHR